MKREYPLDAFPVGNSAHSERFVKSATLTANHHSGEYLNSLLVTFHNACMHPDAVSDLQGVGVGFLLLLLDGLDDLIHKKSWRVSRVRAHTFIRRRRFCNSNSCC